MFHIFQASIRNCLNCVYNCDDHSLLDFNIYVSSAANLVHVERVLAEKLQIWLWLFFLLVKMADRGHGKTSIVFLIIKPKIFSRQNFLTGRVALPFVWISFESVQVHPRIRLTYFYFLRVNFFVQTSTSDWRDQVQLPWGMIDLSIQIWLFLLIPPGNLPPHKRGLKIFHFQLCFTFLENCS